MKVIYVVCLGLCLSVTPLLFAQVAPSDSSPYGLNDRQWEKVNRVWNEKNRMVAVLTRDSVVHYGQLLAVNDSSLLLYADTGFVDSRKVDSLVQFVHVQDIAAIFTVAQHQTISKATRKAIAGGAIGAAIGTALYVILPENVFHPIFIAPAAGSGLLVGLGLGAGQHDAAVIADTTFIFTEEQFNDTASTNENALIWSTYKYTLWQDGLPDSVKWTEDKFAMDSSLSFADVAFDSRKITRTFPEGNAYFSISFKSTQTKYGDPVSMETMYLFNGGYRLNESWSLDAYFSKHNSRVALHAAIGGPAEMSSTSAGLTCSYAILKHDRFNTSPFQLNAGIGLAYSAINFGSGFTGRTGYSQNVFGFMCKMDAAVFLTNRIALVFDVQQAFLQSITLASYDWVQWQTTVAVPAERIATSYFQAALGLRYHF